MSTGRGAAAARDWNERRQLQAMADELDASEEELRRRPEVRIINKYALVVAYIRIGLKGIGSLALLWATVVLLGGFVSDLKSIDFWYLTIIAFLQAAGVFDAIGDARFAFFEDWYDSLRRNIGSWGEKHHLEHTHLPMRQWLNRGLHILVLKIIDVILMAVFFPVVYFTLVGPMLCIVLSTLRVADQDYGILDREASKANLKQGLNLYYYASLVHAAICLLYMVCEVAADQGIVVTVSQRHGFSVEVLDGYLRETKQKCLNDPASTVNWNLITYGAALLDSQLPEDYASGGRVLTMLIDQGITLSIRRLLIRSPRQRIQKLIGTLAWRSPDEREMRWFAALIVEHLAGHLNLAHFPGALECISSLFDPSCHNNGDQEALHLPFVIGRSNPRKRKNLLQKIVKVLCIYVCFSISIFLGLICLCLLKKGGAPKNSGTLELESKQMESGEDLLLPGLRILENLAHDTQNCTLIYNSKDLLSKIVAPVSSKEFVEDIKSSAVWTKVVDGSLKVVSRLMGSSGSTGQKMRRLIANNSNAVKNLEAILDMDMKSNSGIIELQMRALDVLTQLALHHPANTSATKRREKLIERALHIFLTADWMGDYLEDEKRKIDKPTASQQNTLPRPSEGTCRTNRVKQVRGSRAKEKKAKRAAEAHVEKKMKEAQETASRLREKAGEALAMLSSDSEAIKSFTGCKDEDIHRLTELLDSRIKTIECKLSATDTVKIEISIICRISAAVILKHLSNYNKEPTLRKVLTELFQAEASSTPRCWECLLPNCCRNDIENQLDAGQDKRSASQRHNIQQCGERRLQAELISLVAAIHANSNLNFAAILISQPQPVALEDFVVRLKKMVEDNMYATPACLAIQKLTCEMVTGFLQNDRNVEVIDKHNIIGALLKASKVMAGLESSMLFAGVHHDCHGVPLKPLSCILAKRAEDLLAQQKQVQAQGINSGLAGVSAA